jgi:methylglyoxal synthase
MTSQRTNALNSPNSKEVKAEFRICATYQLPILRDWAGSDVILSSFEQITAATIPESGCSPGLPES